jgi:hypothetical protein
MFLCSCQRTDTVFAGRRRFHSLSNHAECTKFVKTNPPNADRPCRNRNVKIAKTNSAEHGRQTPKRHTIRKLQKRTAYQYTPLQPRQGLPGLRADQPGHSWLGSMAGTTHEFCKNELSRLFIPRSGISLRTDRPRTGGPGGLEGRGGSVVYYTQVRTRFLPRLTHTRCHTFRHTSLPAPWFPARRSC